MSDENITINVRLTKVVVAALTLFILSFITIAVQGAESNRHTLQTVPNFSNIQSLSESNFRENKTSVTRFLTFFDDHILLQKHAMENLQPFQICEDEELLDPKQFFKRWWDLGENLTCQEIMTRSLAYYRSVLKTEESKKKFALLIKLKAYRAYIPLARNFARKVSKECGVTDGNGFIDATIWVNTAMFLTLFENLGDDYTTKEKEKILYTYLTEMGAYTLVNHGVERQSILENKCFVTLMGNAYDN